MCALRFLSGSKARHLLCGATLASLFGSYAGAAQAGDDDSTTLTVSTAGLDLASVQGQAAMHRRVERAARSVCDDGDWGTVAAVAAYAVCRDAAVAGAESQLQVLIAKAGHDGTMVADLRREPR